LRSSASASFETSIPPPVARHGPQFLGLAFDLGQGLFELEVLHGHPSGNRSYMPNGQA
jgi:hypothetical protein